MMSAKHFFSILLMTVLSWKHAEGRSGGAPNTTCESMVPGHGSEQNITNPYSIDVASATKYTYGTKITVTINGGVFQGTLLQARRKDSTNKMPVGTFDEPAVSTNLRFLNCSVAGDSITHANKNNKTGVSVMWNPPQEDVGEVEFVATVAQEKNIWWLNTKSSTLTSGTSSLAEHLEQMLLLTMCLIFAQRQ